MSQSGMETQLNDAYLNAWRYLVLMMCSYYVRRFPERCATIDHGGGGRTIDITHFARAFEDDDLAFSQRRLGDYQNYFDSQDLPTHEAIMEAMVSSAEALAQVRHMADQEGVRLVIERLRQTFDLSYDELLLLMVVALGSMDDSVFRALAFSWGNPEIKKVRAAFLCDLCGFTREESQRRMEFLSDRCQLIRMRLLIPERAYSFSGLLPRAFAELGIDQRVIDAIRNADLSANLSPHVHLYRDALKPQALALSRDFLRQFKGLIGQPRIRILLTGARHSGRRTAACSYAQSVLGKRVVAVDFLQELEKLSEEDVEVHFCNILRESLLLDAVLLLRFDGISSGSLSESKLENLAPPLSNHVAHYPGTIIVTSKQNMPIFGRIFGDIIECHVSLPTPARQEKVWREALMGVFDDHELERLAVSYSNNYQLTVGEILMAVQRSLDAHALRGEAESGAKLASHHILEEIRQCFDHDLEALADVVLSDIPIERVILPEATSKVVREILDFARFQRTVLEDWGYRQCSAYGNSLSLLFAGPPGTGKTLLATAMAHELGKILYRVDLSRIVDKYVGETEKNLAKIFDEAAKAQAILLFDEADALFAKRTDVKSSNDRYANLEVNFLIQRLESYHGISILTTNLQTSIDEAFKRRLRYIVDFKEPNAEERNLLWRSLIGPKTPLKENVNWRILADNFELSGGHIRNATLNASIRAAAHGESLGMRFLLEAAIAETQKLGKLVKLSDRVMLMLDDYGVEF